MVWAPPVEIFGARASARFNGRNGGDVGKTSMLVGRRQLKRRERRAPAQREGEGCAGKFKSFLVKPFAVAEGCLVLEITSPDKLIIWRVVLDFPNERLGFDPYLHSACFDDGSPKAVQYALTNFEFKEILVLNGRLEIWNAATGKCLGKTDPCIPQNKDSRRTLQNIFELRDGLETLLWVRNSPLVDACDI